MRRSKLCAGVCVAALSAALLPVLSGCHKAAAPPAPGLTAANGYAATGVSQAQLSALARQSGGDWNKLTPGERKQLLENVGNGNPAAAQTALRQAAGQ